MGRIRGFIEIDGRKCWTLFNSGARNTYVIPEVAVHLVCWDLPEQQPTAIGGTLHKVKNMCALMARVEGRAVQTHARVVEQIGADEEGKPIEVLFGALAMQEWGIRLDLTNEALDLSHYPREFVEF